MIGVFIPVYRTCFRQFVLEIDVLLGQPIKEDIAANTGILLAFAGVHDILKCKYMFQFSSDFNIHLHYMLTTNWPANTKIINRVLVLQETVGKALKISQEAAARMEEIQIQLSVLQRQCTFRDRPLCDTLRVKSFDESGIAEALKTVNFFLVNVKKDFFFTNSFSSYDCSWMRIKRYLIWNILENWIMDCLSLTFQLRWDYRSLYLKTFRTKLKRILFIKGVVSGVIVFGIGFGASFLASTREQTQRSDYVDGWRRSTVVAVVKNQAKTLLDPTVLVTQHRNSIAMKLAKFKPWRSSGTC